MSLNGNVWTGIVETFQKQREFAGGGVRLSGRSRSRTALLAAPYAPARVKATSEDRSMAQLVAEELADTGFVSHYQTVEERPCWCLVLRRVARDGAQMRAFGQLQLAIPYNVWVRGGRLVEGAPNLPLIELTV